MTFMARLVKTRWLMRAPIGLYRIRLGWVFGRRLLLLEHRGRVTGETRFVVVEVVRVCPPHELVIASGFGEKAQWFQNLRAEPHCRVSTRILHRKPAIATIISAPEAQQILFQYRQEHPRTWKMLVSIFGDVAGDENPQFPLVRLRLTSAAHFH